MTSRVLRYELEIGGTTDLAIPRSAQLLHIDVKEGADVVSLWALVHAEMEATRPRSFRVIGTGWEVDQSELTYVGTARSGHYVWHVFEVVP